MSDIHIISAMTEHLLIGKQGQLPWSLPQDLKLFRRLTLGKTVLMGRTTFLGIGHPLSQRNNIVISRTLAEADGITICSSFSKGLSVARQFREDIFCIGGVEIYRQALPFADTLDISWVQGDYEGDRFFPAFDLNDWLEIDRKSFPGFIHCTYSRRNKNTP